MKKQNDVSRRDFFKNSALGAIGAFTVPTLLTGCTTTETRGGEPLRELNVHEIMAKAPDGRPLKAGLVGCGGRGSGAATDFLAAGDGLQITALGDAFPEPLDACRANLKAKGHDIADANCFVGLDSCQKVTDSGVDVVLLCNPPIFRPDDFDYVVEKGKHCFLEKPCATDPTGVRQILMAGRKAAQKGLSVVTGTCLRSSRDIIETYKRVANGAIGDILSAHVLRLGGALWYKQRDPKWSDMEYILRNWVSFSRTSGDFIVEQFIHEIDLMTWFLNDRLPVRVLATGGRQRRQTGDMYDHFSLTYEYDNGMHAHCTSRQIAGCDNRTAVMLFGTKGYADARASKIFNNDGTIAWEYPRPKRDDPDQTWAVPSNMVQEHMRLVNSIRTGKPTNEVEHLANSTLITIMGRESAYSGKFITWEQIRASDLNLRFEKNEFGPIPGFKEEIPLAGAVSKPRA